VQAQQQTNNTSSGLDQTDQKFLNYAAEDNQAEIQLCLIAEKRAANPALRAFARLMVNDHAEIESRLAALGGELQVKMPDGIGEDGQQTLAKLNPLQGDEFERGFMQAQIKDHSEDIQKYSNEQNATRNQRIRQFATETIPILQQHLALARAVDAQVGNETSGKAKSK
jgi:putative membrane protein